MESEESSSSSTAAPTSTTRSATTFHPVPMDERLTMAEWLQLHQQMSFSRDVSHLVWQPEQPQQQNHNSNTTTSAGSLNDCQTCGKDVPTRTVEHSPQPQQEQQIWFCVHFRRLCQICLAMPLVGLVACLFIAVIFQFEHIQETACRVRNFVPSISAVTGISPGRYLWRIAIAFHMGPRILVVASYYHYLLSFANRLPKADAGKLAKLLNWCFYLQIVEIAGLCGISFVHNREHYPTHEKGFILYLSSSHLSFCVVLRIYHILWPVLDTPQKASYRKKLFTMIFSSVCLFLMAYFYYRHIIHCDSFAFSVFAFVEYWVAGANMAFYWTVGCEMPNEEIVVIRPAFPARSAVLADGTADNSLADGTRPAATAKSAELLGLCSVLVTAVRNSLSALSRLVFPDSPNKQHPPSDKKDN